MPVTSIVFCLPLTICLGKFLLTRAACQSIRHATQRDTPPCSVNRVWPPCERELIRQRPYEYIYSLCILEIRKSDCTNDAYDWNAMMPIYSQLSLDKLYPLLWSFWFYY